MNYSIKGQLGKGGYGTVKKAQHKESGQVCALKIIAKNPNQPELESMIENEVNVMKELSHQNIIQLLDYSYNDVYTNDHGRSFEVYTLALELAPNGELFDYIAETGSFSEEVTRHYFRQMMDGLSYMWSKGIKHRDIKPENLLLDRNFVLKFADFGFASDESKSKVRKGTDGYLAPECFMGDEFDTEPLDIFAAGIVLFMMYTACPPFNSAKVTDPHYKLFVNRNDKFWEYHQKRLKNKVISENFKILINAMLNLDATQRPKIEDIKECEWYNGSLPSEEDIIDEF